VKLLFYDENKPVKLLTPFVARLRRCLFGLQAVETNYVRRGFRGATADMQARLDQIGAAFLGGYHAALEHDTPANLTSALNAVEPDLCGFAFEGAAMGLALLDFLTPWRRTRISEFLRGAGHAHAYMVHVGAGWAWARLPVNFRRAGQRLDPVLGWLAFDGWGFHEGFFHWPKYIDGRPPPQKLKGFERRVFDQGFGRSLWFVNGANIELIVQTIANFSPDRQSDLWSGIGLAATYAGIVSEASLDQLREKSGPFQPLLAQGAAFAAKARQRAGNMTHYTGRAAKILCGLSADEAARLTDEALENLPADSDPPAYEIWRRRIQNHFGQTRQIGKT
jgi:enediyne biosynthesis protein E3